MPPINTTPRVVRAFGDSTRKPTSYGWFSFRRTGELIPWKGRLGYQSLVFESVDPDVIGLTRSVAGVRWYDGREWQTHRPHYTVTRTSRVKGETRTTEIEIVWSRDLGKPEVTDKYERIKSGAARDGIDYRLKTEKDLVQPRLQNAYVVMAQAGDRIVPADDAERLARFLKGVQAFTLGSFVASTGLDRDRAYTAVLNRVATGDLRIDLGVAFDDASVIKNRLPHA